MSRSPAGGWPGADGLSVPPPAWLSSGPWKTRRSRSESAGGDSGTSAPAQTTRLPDSPRTEAGRRQGGARSGWGEASGPGPGDGRSAALGLPGGGGRGHEPGRQHPHRPQPLPDPARVHLPRINDHSPPSILSASQLLAGRRMDITHRTPREAPWTHLHVEPLGPGVCRGRAEITPEGQGLCQALWPHSSCETGLPPSNPHPPQIASGG